jgi:excisionase family DNA binding protein
MVHSPPCRRIADLLSGGTVEQLLYKIEASAGALGIGRSKMFELITRGEIETVQIGRSRRVPAQALEDYVARLREGVGTAA